jgi:cysteine desulfurase / selenocysteine lyase
VSATYKWLLGTYGVALLTWNRARVPELEPAIVGWRSVEDGLGADRAHPRWKPAAERLEAGNPPYAAIFYLDVALTYLLGLGMDRIAPHVTGLSERMHQGLRELGVPLATPADPRWRAGNNCFWTDDPEAIVASLAERDIIVSGYSGRMRFSTHIWNDESDVDRCLSALETILHRQPISAD